MNRRRAQKGRPEREEGESLKTKKVDPYWIDLEEAATYSPTGKPQYHRRE